MMLPSEYGEKAFSVEEILELPATMPAPEKMVYYKLCVEVAEQKILTDKLVLRGNAKLHLLYMDNQERLHCWDGEIPISQYSELSRDYTESAFAVLQHVVTNLELENGQDNKPVLKAGLLAQYVIYDRTELSVVEDAYSPRRQLIPHTEHLRLPAVLDTVFETTYAKQTVDNTVLDAVFCPDMPRLYRDADGISADLSGTFYTLISDEGGHLQGLVQPWEERKNLLADPNVVTELTLGHGSVAIAGGNLEAEVPMTVRYLADHEMTVITGMELGELQDSDPERPSLILCRRGEQSLWDIAKETGSTVESIQLANGLTQEPEPDKMLLIPIL